MKTSALMVAVLAGCTSADLAPGPDVMATVNGRAITRAEVERSARMGHGTGGAPAQKAVLESLISQELAAQQAEDIELLPDEAGLKEIARAEAELNTVRRRVLSSALYAKAELQAADVNEKEARAYFDAHEKDLRRQTHVLMVMRRSEAELQQMQAALQSGTTFDDAARALMPVDVKGRPWDLGYVGWAQMPPSWRETVKAMKAGEVSPIIRGDHGRCWLLQLVDVREAAELSFEASLPLVKQAIAVERGSRARDGLDAELRKKARIRYAAEKPDRVVTASQE
jgi:parvulin-like peptidyl-prolyl isomerase